MNEKIDELDVVKLRIKFNLRIGEQLSGKMLLTFKLNSKLDITSKLVRTWKYIAIAAQGNTVASERANIIKVSFCYGLSLRLMVE